MSKPTSDHPRPDTADETGDASTVQATSEPTVPPQPQPVGPGDPVPTPPPPTEPVGPTSPPEPPAAPPSRRGLLVALGALALVVVLFGAFFLGQRASRQAAPAGPAPSTSVARTPVPADFVTYTDPEAGFSLKHPKTWRRIPTEDLQVPEPPNLVISPGGFDYVSVRVTQLEGTVGPDNVGDLKAVTDAIISDAEVRVLEQRSVTVNGMVGYYYLYTFTDTATRQEGLHSHYFLFQGNKMYAVVFQAVPAEAIRQLEPTFDAIRDSFVSTQKTG